MWQLPPAEEASNQDTLPVAQLDGQCSFWDECDPPTAAFVKRRIAAGDKVWLLANGDILLTDP